MVQTRRNHFFSFWDVIETTKYFRKIFLRFAQSFRNFLLIFSQKLENFFEIHKNFGNPPLGTFTYKI